MPIQSTRKINEYRIGFKAACPNNEAVIEYDLVIETERMIMVEAIAEAVAEITSGYHEDIASDLLRRFGGKQTLIAHHHSVDVKTIYEHVEPGEMTSEQALLNLQKQYGGYWGEHPDFPAEDWAAEASNNDTRQSYWDWVVSKIAEDEGQGDPEAGNGAGEAIPLEVKEGFIHAKGYIIQTSEFGGYFFEISNFASQDFEEREDAVSAAYEHAIQAAGR